jgi:hypothetical protein
MNEPWGKKPKMRVEEKYGVQEENQTDEDIYSIERNHVFPEIYYVLTMFEKIHKVNKLTLFLMFGVDVFLQCVERVSVLDWSVTVFSQGTQSFILFCRSQTIHFSF